MTFKNRLKGYRISYSLPAKKFIEKLDKKMASKIEKKLDELVSGSENLDVKKLVDSSELKYRLRVGDYRVIYAVWEDQIIIYIIEIGHRKEIY